MNNAVAVYNGSEEISESIANYCWSVLSWRLKKIRGWEWRTGGSKLKTQWLSSRILWVRMKELRYQAPWQQRNCWSVKSGSG